LDNIYKTPISHSLMKVGGQAIIEGIVMRSKDRVAAAVRLEDGRIKVRHRKVKKVPWLFRQFFFRGMYSLVMMLIDGMRYLTWSANEQLGDEEKIKTEELVGTITISLLFGAFLFVGLPFLLTLVTPFSGVLFTLFEGLVRVIIFLSYIIIISFMPDVKRMFQYHGAEHKSIHCYESKKPLTVVNVQEFTTLHPRCGTSFIFVVLIVSIILFAFIQGSIWVKLLGRLLLMPVVAGLSYELLKLGDKFSDNVIMKIVIAPGLWLQKITTQPPSDDQVEVGIVSLRKVCNLES